MRCAIRDPGTTAAKQDFGKGDGVGVVMGKTVHPRTEIGILQEADVSHAGRWFLGSSPGSGGVSCVASAATAKWVIRPFRVRAVVRWSV